MFLRMRGTRLDFFEGHYLSGHSIGTNQESYLDQNVLVLTFPGVYALNGWLGATPNKLYPRFHCLGPHVMERDSCMIRGFYIVSLPQFKLDGSLNPVFLAASDILVMYHYSPGTYIVHGNYIYTNMCKSSGNSKIDDLNIPKNEPLLVLEYWSKKIEEKIHLCNPDNRW